MTMEQAKELQETENKKHKALQQMIAILEKLESEVDAEAAEWVLEKLSE